MAFVRVEKKSGFTEITLQREDVRNAFNPEMIAEITKAFQSVKFDLETRAVVFSGSGKAFCAGADLAWMKSMVDYSFSENQKDAEVLFEMFEAIRNCEVPVIAKVHGSAFGGALGLLAAADYVIADEGTQMSFSEVKLGIAPAVISTFVLRKAVPGVVAPLMLSGKLFTAKDVLGSGLVHEAVPVEQLDSRVSDFIATLSQGGPEAVRETKKLINELWDLNFSESKKATSKVIAERRSSEEGQDGLRSFLEKRRPKWQGTVS